MNYGITKTEKFEKTDGGRWIKIDEFTNAHAIIDSKHWESWQKFDSFENPNEAKLKASNGLMQEYEAYSPSGLQKIRVTVLKKLGGNYLDAFDKLDGLTLNEFLNLRDKAAELAKRKGLDFSESCYITSGDYHGFWFPNNKDYSGIFFCKGCAVLVYRDLVNF